MVKISFKHIGTILNLCLVLLFGFLPTPLPVDADTDFHIEKCDAPFSAWIGGSVQAVSGMCIPAEDASISFEDDVIDFNLSFDATFSSSSKITINLRSRNYYKIELVITPKQAIMTGYIYGGMVTAIERSDTILDVKLDIPLNEMQHIEISHQRRSIGVMVGDSIVGKGKIDAMYSSPGMKFNGGVTFDNLLLEEYPFDHPDTSFHSFSDEILKTYIIFSNTEGLWRIHPDGSGLEKVGDIANIGAPDFSPDGKTIAVKTDNYVVLVDMDSNQVLPAWRNGSDARYYCWTSDGNILLQMDYGSLQFSEYDIESGSLLKTYTVPMAIDSSNFVTQSVGEFNC